MSLSKFVGCQEPIVKGSESANSPWLLFKTMNTQHLWTCDWQNWPQYSCPYFLGRPSCFRGLERWGSRRWTDMPLSFLSKGGLMDVNWKLPVSFVYFAKSLFFSQLFEDSPAVTGSPWSSHLVMLGEEHLVITKLKHWMFWHQPRNKQVIWSIFNVIPIGISF